MLADCYWSPIRETPIGKCTRQEKTKYLMDFFIVARIHPFYKPRRLLGRVEV